MKNFFTSLLFSQYSEVHILIFDGSNKTYSIIDNGYHEHNMDFSIDFQMILTRSDQLIHNRPIFQDYFSPEYHHLDASHQFSLSASCRSTILSIWMHICAVLHPPLGSLSTKCHFIPFYIVIYHRFADMFR